MATNLVEQVAATLGPVLVGRIASSLGLNETATQKAVVAAIPALLAALISYVSKPQGATKLNNVLKKQEPGLLSSVANAIGGSGEKALIDQGAGLLTSLIGGKMLSGLANAVGQYAGIQESSSKSLMGLLGPMVLGALGNEQRNRGLDASGLASLLNSQKDSVQAALPSGFSKYLSQVGILDEVTRAATDVASRTPERSTSSSWTWVLWVLALLAIAFFAWRFLSTPEQTAQAPSSKTAEGRTLDVSQCETAWTAISPNDEALSKEGAASFVINVTEIDSNGDGSISEVEFNEGCTSRKLRVAMDFPCCP